jgi:hypothetical protein
MVDANGAIGRYDPSMRNRYQKFIWRIQDNVMPVGPPFFLTVVILLLLILNGIVALNRW